MRYSAIAIIALLIVAAPLRVADAHHSFAMFDSSKQVTLVGVVKEFQFTNPHSWIQLTVIPKEGAAPEEWAIEALSPNVLMRNGWKRNSLKAGDKVTVLINPLRNGSKGGNLILVTLPDGTTLGGGAA
jgi:Family of unknown function (DUF6152)